MKSLTRFSTFIGKTFAIWVLIFAVLAFMIPNLFSWIAPYINPLLMIIMFGMGLTLTTQDFKNVLKAPFKILVVAVAQFVAMPIIAVSLVFLFNLPKEIAIGVILVGCCPGGTSSNVITYLARGNVALSVTATSVTTLLAPIVTPALTLWLAGAYLPVSFNSLFLSIVKIVLIPIILGFAVQYFFETTTQKAVGLLPLISVVGIIGVLTAVVANNTENIIKSGLLILIVVVLHNVLGYVLGYFIGKLFKFNLADKKTTSIEVGMQNSGLAAALATTHFDPIAAVPGAIFSIWHNFSGSIVANFYSKMSEDKNKKKSKVYTLETEI
ncbi:putative sodium-dependent transporter YocS [Phocicoccus schoeneichii]|uniref:Sodium Bile acid symporter family protein n=1 Tax=Phocicoccus schoeneichii TaxID=1812261 RepID=A0A6V7RFI5_9BACL|nr:bile acid:sodium symporter family protein [Jeotgalicoccus schoeneichii]GGH49983.1 putative sodium-dependent transporter YocS [Jeotgalicoccus schoeneichii]CAD2075699.1 Sodium Bile acid symporter family protein [Jeotgalicoccus schoeneichii]